MPIISVKRPLVSTSETSSASVSRDFLRAEHYRRQLETVAENATLALFIMDEQQQCTYMNRAAERLTGFQLDEVQGKPLHDIIHHTRPDGTPYPLEECPIDQAFPQNMREQGEEVFVHKDGHFYPVAFTASPILDDGRPVGTIIEVRDISDELREKEERERLVRELELQRARLTTVFRQAPAFIATLRGPDHVFEMANPAYLQLVGHRDVVGKPVREALPEVVEQGFVDLLDDVRRTGEAFVGTEVPVRLQLRPESELVERFVNFVYQPLTDASGAVDGILVHGVEVTELVSSRRCVEDQAERLREANEEIARERAQFATVIEHAPIGILIAEAPSGRIVMGNRRVEEILRHPVLQSGDVDSYQEWVAFHPDGRRVRGSEYPLGRVFATGEPAGPDEYLYQRGDGTLGWVQITGAPIRDSRGEMTGGLVVVDDIDAQKRAEQDRERLIRELDAERSRLHELLEQAPAMIAVLRGRELVFEMANPIYLRGIGRSEVIGKPLREVLPEIAGQGYFEMLEGIFDTGEAVLGNESLVRFDRTGDGVLDEAYFNFVFQPLRDGDGAVDGILIHAVEVTEQVRARAEVERLEERLRLSVEAADVGIYDWDIQSSALNWDRRARRIFGVPEAGPVTYEDFERALHPEDAESASAAVEAAMDPRSNGDFATEYRIVCPDGEVRWVRAVGRVYFRGEGEERRAVRFLGTVQDITERREAEAERERLIGQLETERARLRQVFAEAPAVMALYSGPEHIITMVNPTWEKLVGRPDVVGLRFRDAFPEFEGTGLVELLDRVYETGEPYIDPEIHAAFDRRGTGVLEDTYWSLVWRPLAGIGEHGRDILVHAVEVTDQVVARQEVERKADELAQLARQLEASNRELDQFAYVASHDLKAPLRGIANLSQWIEEDLGERVTEDAREHLELLRGRVHRMEGLIDGILQYSRAGRVREQPEPVDVEALLHDVVDLLAPPEGFQVSIGEGMPTLLAERLPLQQVLMNLIGNAIKYNSSDEPRVEIGVEDRGRAFEFSVSDNGPGIAAEYHERIFGIFQTLEARDKVEGTGIGLSLVKKLVESRGGRIWLESEPGAGSTFRFTWPKEPLPVS